MKIYTTGQVAKMCDVPIRTVSCWVETGRLPVSRTPHGDVRIRRDDLIAFCDKYGFPLELSAGRKEASRG